MDKKGKDMFKAVKIEIGFSESPEVNPNGEVFEGLDCWEKAQKRLNAIAAATPEDLLGYHKTDITITFEDGEAYEGRLDIKHIHSENADHRLAKHIRHFFHFYTRRWKPFHLTNEQYLEILSRHTKVEIAALEIWMGRYEIPPD